MTNPKWLVGLMTIFIVFQVLCGLVEKTYGVETTRLILLMKPSLSVTYLQTFWDMLWFNYSFFHGGWEILKYVLFWPISIGLVISFVATIVMGLIGVLRGLFSA